MTGPSARVLRAVVARRRNLWTVLVALVAALLATLIWLAGRYEDSQFQERLERDVNASVGDLRATFLRHVQSVQALQVNDPTPNSWNIDAASLLSEQREFVRI